MYKGPFVRNFQEGHLYHQHREANGELDPINAETREKIQKAILEAYEAPETEESAE